MADAVAVKWSTLFPRTGGSGRGGAFTGKVFTPAMSPYLVRAGDRLVVMPTDQALVIDPSDLGSDDAFQVIDASRTFDKNNVTIKGDKVAIQIVGAGNDLILDMIGAGNLWEFIVTGDKPKPNETDTRQLLVADSPGYTGDLSGGGGSAPANGGGPSSEVLNVLLKDVSGISRWFMVDKVPNDQEATILGAASTTDGEGHPLETVVHSTFVVDSTTGDIYYWPPNQTASQGEFAFDPTKSHWVKVSSGGGTVDSKDWKFSTELVPGDLNAPTTDMMYKALSEKVNLVDGKVDPNQMPPIGNSFVFKQNAIQVPEFQTDSVQISDVAPGDFVRVMFSDEVVDPNIRNSVLIQNAVIRIPPIDPNNLLPIRILRDGHKPAGPNPYLPATMIVRIADNSTSYIAGTWDAFDQNTDQAVGLEFDDPGEFVELTPMLWGDGSKRWVITSSNYDEVDTDVLETTTDVPAVRPGQTIIARAELKVTVPEPDLDDPAPIVIFHHPMPDATAGFSVRIFADNVSGTFRGRELNMQRAFEPDNHAMKVPTIILVEPGDWVRLEPFGANADKFWVITGSGGSSQDTIELTKDTPGNLPSDDGPTIMAFPGQTILVREKSVVGLPQPDLNDPQPITIILYPKIAEGATVTDQLGYGYKISTVKTRLNRGIFGRYGDETTKIDGGLNYLVNADGIDMTNEMGGSWIRFEASGGVDDPFWLIVASGRRYAGEA